MAAVTFALVETVVSDGSNRPVPGPVGTVIGAWSAALKTRVTDFWTDMSGGRVELLWAADVQLRVSQTLEQWSLLSTQEKIDEARAQANIPPGTEILLMANDAVTPSASTPKGSSPYVHVLWASPAVVTHELGHFFGFRGTGKAGHADIAREFFRDEYADRTCIMGGEDNKLAFADPAVPALPLVAGSRKSGPGMNPALVDQCGWLDTASPRVRTINPSTLGTVLLQAWSGAPRAGSEGAPTVAIIDNLDADGGRIYLCVREESGWDRRFSALSGPVVPAGPGPHLRVLAYLSTPSGDSLLLNWMYAFTGTHMVLGRVPLKVTVANASPEGVDLQLERSAWRGSSILEGVQCDAAARVATAAWGNRVDAYVIDTRGAVRYNHFNGHGWEFKPWPVIDGITCDPKGGIAAVARKEGLIDIFVVDTSGAVHRRQRIHREWSGAWERIEGGGLNARSSIAAARIDDNTVMLCGVRSDEQVSRVEIGAAGALSAWSSAPARRVRSVAASPDATYRGRIYGVDARNRDRSVWATPDIASPNPASWGVVGRRAFDPKRPIASTRRPGGEDVIILGLDPLIALLWNGTDWQEEVLGDTRRLPEGGLAVFSRDRDSFEVAYVDPDGLVNVAAWSPRPQFKPAANQYESQSTVLIQAGTGHFVQAKEGGGDGMGADGTQNGPWERLRMFECQTVIINGGKTRRIVAFQTHNGQYVGAVGGGGAQVIAQASVIGPWELFYLDVLPGGFGKVTIQCSNEVHYWTAPGGGGGPLGADKTVAQQWETFLLGTISV
jgi:hypothetical protein